MNTIYIYTFCSHFASTSECVKRFLTDFPLPFILSISWVTMMHLYRTRTVLKIWGRLVKCKSIVHMKPGRERKSVFFWRFGGAAGRWSSADGGRGRSSLDVSDVQMCLQSVYFFAGPFRSRPGRLKFYTFLKSFDSLNWLFVTLSSPVTSLLSGIIRKIMQ